MYAKYWALIQYQPDYWWSTSLLKHTIADRYMYTSRCKIARFPCNQPINCATGASFLFFKYKQKFVILQSIGIMVIIKTRETKSVIYTCRYSSGQFNS